MHNDYLTGNSLEIFQQRDSRELAQRALVIGNKLGNKLDNYIHYLEYIWQDNSQIMDYLAQVAILASSSASIERVFSFFHRQTSYFLRRAISSATLSSMAYIYIEEIIEEMHLWDGKNYIRTGLDQLLYDEMDLEKDIIQNDDDEEESDWVHDDIDLDE
ncbi:Hypothetical_protein [Hexamita inflata]|uniref:Hypothetical_protein n=1 Tax=Hexamita inflata TaxID=28002 RepID=A0AA86NBH4_9EUKA|nr:Hypothetical protein HINF_LOCUS3604 [Hexamita inflata]